MLSDQFFFTGSYPFAKAFLRVPILYVKAFYGESYAFRSVFFTGSYPFVKTFLRVPILFVKVFYRESGARVDDRGRLFFVTSTCIIQPNTEMLW